jgi:hypothetical protein
VLQFFRKPKPLLPGERGGEVRRLARGGERVRPRQTASEGLPILVPPVPHPASLPSGVFNFRQCFSSSCARSRATPTAPRRPSRL